jgi:hypothetical protein
MLREAAGYFGFADAVHKVISLLRKALYHD